MKLLRLEINAFKNISPDAPVVVEFPTKITKVKGDNGVGKTSFGEAVLVGLGALSKENKDFINKDSGKLDVGLSFEGKDKKEYYVKVTKSRFELKYKGESLPEPVAKMKELVGVPGVSPMELKSAPLKTIVKWLSTYTTKGAEEFEKRMSKLKEGIKLSKVSRADANRAAKGLREYLNSEELYLNWEKSEATYKNKVDIKFLSAQLDAAGKRSDNLIKAQEKLRQLKERDASICAQIEALQNEQEEIRKSIKTGEKYVEDNKDAGKEYTEIKKQFDSVSHKAIAYEKWQDIKRKKSELDEFETLSQQADAKEKELLEEVKELQAEIIPDIKGVSLVLEDEYEDGKLLRKEGLYRGGVNVAQMSETEWWAICMEVWKKNKVKVVVIDNLQSLGTLAVENLTKLAKEGCYIFAAEMERGVKELIIEHTNNV